MEMERDLDWEEGEVLSARNPSPPPPPPGPPKPPLLSEGACENATFIWELEQSKFPALVIPVEEIVDPRREPGRDSSKSIFDLLGTTLPSSGMFVRGQDIGRPTEWKLRLEESSENPADKDSARLIKLVITCVRFLNTEVTDPLWTKVGIEIIDRDGIAIRTSGCVFDAEPRHFLRGTSYALALGSKDQLVNSRMEYVPDGILRIRLRLVIYDPVEPKDRLQNPPDSLSSYKLVAPPNESFRFPPEVEPALASTSTSNSKPDDGDGCPAAKRMRLEKTFTPILNALENLWKSREQSGDTSIQCRDASGTSHTVKVHKCILSARSSVFLEMLDRVKETKEAESGVVVIEDIPLQTLEFLFEYLYTDRMTRFDWTDVDQIGRLIYAADKYFIVPLLVRCYQELMKVMHLENFAKIARLTFTHNSDKEFKAEVRHFYDSHQRTLNAVESFRTFAQENYDEFYKLYFYNILSD